MTDTLQLDHIIKLAHLEIPQEEKPHYQKQLEKILDYVHILNQLDLSQIPPSAYASEELSNLRKDTLVPDDQKDPIDVSKIAPHLEDHCFKVPKIIT